MPSLLPPPICAVDAETFARMIRVTRLNARFVTPVPFVAGPSLPGRLRGAWGRALLDTGASGADAADLFFGRTGSAHKPFSLSAEDTGGELHVSLALFGVADQHRAAAFDALMTGLTEGEGIALTDAPHAERRALRLLHAGWTRREGVETFGVADTARLVFRTPVKIGPRDTLGATYSDIWVSAAIRAAAMARWSGLDLAPGVGRVRALANAMAYRDDGLAPRRWDRWSSRKPGLRRAMMGMEGTLTIERWREELTPLLHLAQVLHVGANVSFGLGRFEIG